MGRAERVEIREADVRGLRHFKRLRGLLSALHHHATARDRAGNRTLHYDQYVLLVLLHLFNPVSSGLRSICRASAPCPRCSRPWASAGSASARSPRPQASSTPASSKG